MNNIRKIFFSAVALCLCQNILTAQVRPCFKIVDTLHIQAHIITIRFDCSECPSFQYIVSDDTQKEQAIHSFLTHTTPPHNQLMLSSYVDSRFFALLKIFSEDSLIGRFSNKEISKAFMHFRHPDSTEQMRVPSLSSSLRRIGNLVYLNEGTRTCTPSLHCLNEIAFIKKKVPSKFSHKYKNIYDGKKRHTYLISNVPIDSWGIVVEFIADCQQCFFNDTQECLYLSLWPEEKLRLFIPMSNIAN